MIGDDFGMTGKYQGRPERLSKICEDLVGLGTTWNDCGLSGKIRDDQGKLG